MAHGTRTAGLLALLLISGAARAGGTRPSFSVEARAGYTAVRPGEELTVAVVFDIAQKHKIYAETVEIHVPPGETGKLLGVDRPVPIEKYDKATDETRRVYLGRAVFGLAVEAPEPDQPGEVDVRLAVMSVPTLMLFAGGEMKKMLTGSPSKAEILKAVEPHLGV